PVCLFFFFNDTATTEIYTLSLHDALPISRLRAWLQALTPSTRAPGAQGRSDRKSTRLNSSHLGISYAVFCLKKRLPPNTGDKQCPRCAHPRWPTRDSFVV